MRYGDRNSSHRWSLTSTSWADPVILNPNSFSNICSLVEDQRYHSSITKKHQLNNRWSTILMDPQCELTDLLQPPDFMLHLHGLGIKLRQSFSFPRMLHFWLEYLEIVQLPPQVINQLQRGDSVWATFGCLVAWVQVGEAHLLHGLLLLLELVAVLPNLVHDLPVQIQLILQPQTRVFQLVWNFLLLLQSEVSLCQTELWDLPLSQPQLTVINTLKKILVQEKCLFSEYNFMKLEIFSYVVLKQSWLCDKLCWSYSSLSTLSDPSSSTQWSPF